MIAASPTLPAHFVRPASAHNTTSGASPLPTPLPVISSPNRQVVPALGDFLPSWFPPKNLSLSKTQPCSPSCLLTHAYWERLIGEDGTATRIVDTLTR